MISKTQAYQQIEALVHKFAQNETLYKNRTYNETETRNEFLDPFWKALGWDLENTKRLPPAYKEVQVEKTQKTEGKNKKPDYAFCNARNQKVFFYVEAKKPFVNLKDELEPAVQLRNYGFQNSDVKISILSDFEEFVIYNCRLKPKSKDLPKVAQIEHFTYRDYLTKFDFFWETFAYENVIKGSIDAFTSQFKQITQSKDRIDLDFLASLNNWRTYLATNIAQHHPDFDEYTLTYAVQQTLDRIIFLKIAEDRAIEPEGQLRAATKKGKVYDNIFQLFRDADARYNSGLFDFKKDNTTRNLKIDNKILQNIIQELYDGNEEAGVLAYRFDIIPVEILGNAYEQFLGNVIVINEKGTAQIQPKPEVRKAGGVFYTPAEIVDYIVEHTLGKLVAGKIPEQIAQIKVLDPSCGSGSFLLGAYNYLLRYHLDYYTQKKNQSTKNKYLTPHGDLTTAVKKQILLNNIYGVDIDASAVEVSKLSLLIKCLEGETQASIQTQLSLLKERVLPTLDNNILCGNSLIATDFYESSLFLTPKERRKINTFDWAEGYKSILKAGGFDVILGNPPYGAGFNEEAKKYLKSHYPSSDKELESYLIFIEKAYYLLKSNGTLGYIIPSNLFTNISYQKTRELLLKTSINELLGLGSNVFSQASVDTCIVIFNKNFQKNNQIKSYVGSISQYQPIDYQWFSQSQFSESSNKLFNIYNTADDKDLEKKIEKNKDYLINLVKFARGIEFGYKSEHTTDKATVKNAKPLVAGRCINRFELKFEKKYVLFDENDVSNFKDKAIYENPKILVRRIGQDIIATLDEEKYYNVCDVYNLLAKNGTNLKFVLGVLNSKLMSFYLKNKFKNAKKLFPKIPIAYLEQLPIPVLNVKDKTEKAQHDKLVSLVEQMLNLQKEKVQATTPQDLTQTERLITATDRQINTLVYALYDLSEAEIALIEK
ncbi:MAG: N-6 DNA methylase [Microscillaceae bacterium]|jgi:type I restriction-modification system DNA methylase subunit|nr:N-6 DNA methylase [Microscillaceae bacterium]